jgi:hypothetical protein
MACSDANAVQLQGLNRGVGANSFALSITSTPAFVLG